MEPLVIAGRAFQSRLIVGTGKYKDGAETQRAIEASGTEMVTVAVRRVNLDRTKESLLDFIDPQRYFLLPIRRAATRRMRQSAQRGWGVRWDCRIGSRSR